MKICFTLNVRIKQNIPSLNKMFDNITAIAIQSKQIFGLKLNKTKCSSCSINAEIAVLTNQYTILNWI